MIKDMKGHTASHWTFLARLAATLLSIFAFGKVFFMVYNREVMPFSLSDIASVWLHGFSMDLSTTGYLVVLPWLLSLVCLWAPRLPFRKVLVPYYILVALVLGLVICGDAFLYEFWKFKLNAAVFSYMQSASGTTNSVSPFFLLTRTTAFIVAIGLIGYLLIRITPSHLSATAHRIRHSATMVVLGGLIFLCIRGSIGTSTMNVGVAYYSPHLFLNHSAVNPAFSLLSSISKTKDFSGQFNYFPETERASLFDSLYATPTPSVTDTLLNTSRPNVLLILMESYGSRFIEELGGITGVSPHFSRLVPEGIFWDNLYCNSFRTDRGTVSALSGWTSYPTASLMKMPEKLGNMPSIAKSMQKAGYSTDFLYGGDIEIMGMKGYLVGSGYQHITSDADFSLSEAKESKWGANDAVTAQRVFKTVGQKPADTPWFMTYLTLSSHEPFEVPYNRLEDPKLNAFAFTDECVGSLIDSLRTLPVWDNLLVILLPDHGFLYDITYEDPAFFHCPMLWLGGAVRQPKRIHTLMNQSDMAATLLAQMELPHDDFPWSRNVMSPHYSYHFAYSSFPGGILFADSTGMSVYDITGEKSILERPAPDPLRVNKAKAILQSSYDKLDAMNSNPSTSPTTAQ